MAVKQVEPETRKNQWGKYLLLSIGILLSVLVGVAVVYFWEEIRHAEGYGYTGGFLVSIMGGVTVIPVPSLVVIFTLGGILNPVYVGLLSGLGEAIGGITVYLTGAGGGAMWSKLFSRRRISYDQSGSNSDNPASVEPKIWSRGEAFYNRLVGWVGRRGSSWVLFVVSAMPISPFYFAGLAAGTLHMGLKRFFLICLAGKIIRGFTIAFAGYGGLYFLLEWMGR